MKKTILIGLFLILITGCVAQEQKPVESQKSDVSGRIDVSISNFAFSNGELRISKGTTVVWTNEDSARHNVVSYAGDELSSDFLPRGGTFSHTFNNQGTFDYYCSLHPSMKGKVIVE